MHYYYSVTTHTQKPSQRQSVPETHTRAWCCTHTECRSQNKGSDTPRHTTARPRRTSAANDVAVIFAGSRARFTPVSVTELNTSNISYYRSSRQNIQIKQLYMTFI